MPLPDIHELCAAQLVFAGVRTSREWWLSRGVASAVVAFAVGFISGACVAYGLSAGDTLKSLRIFFGDASSFTIVSCRGRKAAMASRARRAREKPCLDR